MTTANIADWIRPWYPAGTVGHVDPECPELLKHVTTPTEGPGWLDPHAKPVQGATTCTECVPGWDAECAICDASMSDDPDDERPYSEAQAKEWKRQHRCQPIVRIIAPDATRKARR